MHLWTLSRIFGVKNDNSATWLCSTWSQEAIASSSLSCFTIFHGYLIFPSIFTIRMLPWVVRGIRFGVVDCSVSLGSLNLQSASGSVKSLVNSYVLLLKTTTCFKCLGNKPKSVLLTLFFVLAVLSLLSVVWCHARYLSCLRLKIWSLGELMVSSNAKRTLENRLDFAMSPGRWRLTVFKFLCSRLKFLSAAWRNRSKKLRMS